MKKASLAYNKIPTIAEMINYFTMPEIDDTHVKTKSWGWSYMRYMAGIKAIEKTNDSEKILEIQKRLLVHILE